MAGNTRVVRMGVYVGSLLIAEVSSATYTHTTNDEQGHGTDNAQYFSTGNDITSIEFTAITPKAGMASLLKNLLLGHADVTCACQVDGGVEKCDGRFESRSYKSDSKTGMVTGDFKFMGGLPKVV